jgi:hypothetical protein
MAMLGPTSKRWGETPSSPGTDLPARSTPVSKPMPVESNARVTSWPATEGPVALRMLSTNQVRAWRKVEPANRR